MVRRTPAGWLGVASLLSLSGGVVLYILPPMLLAQWHWFWEEGARFAVAPLVLIGAAAVTGLAAGAAHLFARPARRAGGPEAIPAAAAVGALVALELAHFGLFFAFRHRPADEISVLLGRWLLLPLAIGLTFAAARLRRERRGASDRLQAVAYGAAGLAAGLTWFAFGESQGWYVFARDLTSCGPSNVFGYWSWRILATGGLMLGVGVGLRSAVAPARPPLPPPAWTATLFLALSPFALFLGRVLMPEGACVL